MRRHELIEMLNTLKLYGMAGSYDELVVKGIRRKQTIEEILEALCNAETAERKVRSIRYQMRLARFPVQ